MADEAIELIETPDTCDETTENEKTIEDEVEIEPENEVVSAGEATDWDGLEREFSRFESNFRARRIREITAPLSRRKNRRRSSPDKAAA